MRVKPCTLLMAVAIVGCTSEKPVPEAKPDSAPTATAPVQSTPTRDTVAERIARDTLATLTPDTCAADTAARRTVAYRDFQVTIPSAARAQSHDSGAITTIHIDSIPGCPGCFANGRLWPDSIGDGVDGRIRRILREEARIDSLNNDPKTTLHEFNNYNPPARRVKGAGDSAIFIYGDCGDCLTESYFFGIPGRIAEIALVVDDGGVNARVCDLRRAVLSFRWKR